MVHNLLSLASFCTSLMTNDAESTFHVLISYSHVFFDEMSIEPFAHFPSLAFLFVIIYSFYQGIVVYNVVLLFYCTAGISYVFICPSFVPFHLSHCRALLR